MVTTKLQTSDLVRISQGGLFRDIEMLESIHEDENRVTVYRISFPLVVVLTQDCDLEQEDQIRWRCLRVAPEQHPHDKFLISAIVAPVYNAEHFFDGAHLMDESIKMKMQSFNGSNKNTIRQNSNPRYHYLNFDPETRIVPSVVDFKHYFSVSTKILNSAMSRCIGVIADLHREDLSQRFSSFLSRIGLPD